MAPIRKGKSSLSKVSGRTPRSVNKKSQQVEEATPSGSRRQSTSPPPAVSTRTLRSRTNGTEVEKKPANYSAKHPIPRPKLLTARRSKMVEAFLEMFKTNPQNYTDYGSEDWILSLIEHMKEAPRYVISPLDVIYWIETERIFEEANRIYGQNAVNSAVGTREDGQDDVEYQHSPLDLSIRNVEKEQRKDVLQNIELAQEVQPYEPMDTTTEGAGGLVPPSFDELAEVILGENAEFMANLAEPEVTPCYRSLSTPPHHPY